MDYEVDQMVRLHPVPQMRRQKKRNFPVYVT